jgi:tRNA(Ile)-lysidine synthetase-like protein
MQQHKTDMKIDLQPGKYVVAVSGGIDSMVLLDLLRAKPGVEVVVAHFDHGIRDDSHLDAELVEQTAKSYGFPYGLSYGKLGAGASEAAARTARYNFLRETAKQYKALAIITAHHQDDVLETAVINLLRGTNRKGLGSLQSTDEIVRPLLSYSKSDIKDYATRHKIVWREDSTNSDETYLRNFVRHQIIPRLSTAQREKLVHILHDANETNQQLDIELTAILGTQSPQALSRALVTGLPHTAARELIASWLRAAGLRDFDRQTLERLAVAAKTAKAGSRADVIKNYSVEISKTDLALKHVER